MKCPCCDGTGEVKALAGWAPAGLSPLQFRIWDILRKSQDGLSIEDLIERVYDSRPKGRPSWAQPCIAAIVRDANLRLAKVKLCIVSSKGHGSIYRLERVA